MRSARFYLALALTVCWALPASGQRQPPGPRPSYFPGYARTVTGARNPRSSLFLPGRPPPTKVTILRPQAQQPDPERAIIRPGEENADPTRRIALPGSRPETGRPQPNPMIVEVRGRSFDAMLRALRSVGEHRVAASMCRQAGGTGCGASRSVRELSPAIRRGAASISNGALTDTPIRIYSAGNRFAANEDAPEGPAQMPRLERVHGRNDPMAARAFDKARVVLAFYRTVLGRRSTDDQNRPMRFIIHYGVDHANAAHYGTDESTFPNSVAFGDGDLLNHPQIEGDTPYHEVTHGVVAHTANFEYEGETGALHEHFADVLGETAQQWELGHSVREAAWVSGEGTYRIGSPRGATRSLRNPSDYNHPGHVREAQHYEPHHDTGGVHELAGIPNRAFYLAAQRLGGHSWEHVGIIWYAALRDLLGPTSTFRDAARATIRAASDLFGPRSREAAAVRAGWLGVGIRATRRP